MDKTKLVLSIRATVYSTIVLLLSGCAAQRPVLYPNEHLKQVGQTAAQADVNDCINLAERNGLSGNRSKRVAKSAGVGGAIGAATGAVTGAILSHPGRGAAIGAVAGGVGSGLQAMFQSDKPDPLVARFVERCLGDKGYETIGWR